ncbi:TPA: YdcF family protein [Clostridium botulinum]|uniref:YdcF family protein n=1 Tax=Clostridium botulinum TaxID=1491 RepID=UPI000D0D442B|nr:YdcF family protein [Clostridium botulinum]PSL98329.1 YdcF family protein [Clostridium botulinum]HDK7138115.1 YdcF family protein [Clostridium botulinum]HDK7141443.1 YdcF family protein [Clostridium botulinum]HDK7145266.1 YdcF family protein [Clostridium botulinum]HDK7148918.1 YdcF family protein [Clostridium botulinum]
MYFLLFIFIALTVGFFAMLHREPRTLWIGLVFLLWVGSVFAFLGILSETYEIKILLTSIIVIIIIIMVGFPLYLLSFIFILIKSGYKLIKKEGARVTNFLSLSLGIFIILWIWFTPNIIRGVTNPILTAIIAFITFLITYFFMMMFIFAISAAINIYMPKRKRYDYIIVLGSGLIGDRVPPLLASRIDKGIEIYKRQLKKGNPSKIIFTGAKGADEKISEGLAMWKYAKDKGIPTEHMIIEDQAVNTYENLYNSKKLLEEDYKAREKEYRCIVVTNSFHLFRSLIWARIVGLECDGAGSKTKLYFSLNALIREYIGVMYIYKKINMIIISLAFLFSILMTIIDVYLVRPFL